MVNRFSVPLLVWASWALNRKKRRFPARAVITDALWPKLEDALSEELLTTRVRRFEGAREGCTGSYTVRAARGSSRTLRVSHSKAALCGAFVWPRGRLNGRKRRLCGACTHDNAIKRRVGWLMRWVGW
jgi:hypothetical protein